MNRRERRKIARQVRGRERRRAIALALKDKTPTTPPPGRIPERSGIHWRDGLWVVKGPKLDEDVL